MGSAISLLTLVLIASGELEPEPRKGKAGKSKAELSASSKAGWQERAPLKNGFNLTAWVNPLKACGTRHFLLRLQVVSVS